MEDNQEFYDLKLLEEAEKKSALDSSWDREVKLQSAKKLHEMGISNQDIELILGVQLYPNYAR